METRKSQNNSAVDSNRLDRFIHRISGTRETPKLIQMIAGSGEWMELTRELVNTASIKDTDLWRQFSRACQGRNQDPDNLKAKLVPVARSLSLIVYDNQQQDYYTLLGIAPTTSSEEIRKAYHRKAKSLHPDTRDSGGDDQAFVELADGYRVLKDPALREHYDQSRQSTGAWHESSVRMGQDRDEAGHKSRRNRYFLQLSGVVVFMIFAVFIFNLIYEFRAINDGYYILPQPEKSISDSSDELILEESQEADRVIDRFEQNDSKEEFLSPDLAGRITSIPSTGMRKDVEKKLAGALTGVSHSDQKQVARSGLMVSNGEKARSAVSIELETKSDVEKGLSSFITDENHEVIENTGGSVTTEQRGRAPKAQADISTEVKKKAVENKTPSLHEEIKAENNPEERSRQSASLEGVQDTAHSASELLRKFAAEEGEIKRVAAFIRRYSETYERKNYSEFSRLFTKDATENGKVFSELALDYHRIFTVIEKLEYEIEIHRTSLLVDREIIRTGGIYKIAWQPYDGVRRESEGPISFDIVKRNGEYRVQKLKYGQIKP